MLHITRYRRHLFKHTRRWIYTLASLFTMVFLLTPSHIYTGVISRTITSKWHRKDPNIDYLDNHHGVNVILYAKLRTGSTFASQFFAVCHEGLYAYEPLQYWSRKVPRDIDTQLRTLRHVFACNIEDSDLLTKHTPEFQHRMFCKLRWSLCDGSTPFGGAQQLCENAVFRVAKVIRVARIQDLLPLMRRGVKVIHLMRDPRGVYNSRFNVNMETRTGRIEFYCNASLEDFEFIQEMKRHLGVEMSKLYYPIHYEDLAANATQGMHKLYKFLNATPCKTVVEWTKQVDAGRGNKTNYASEDVDIWDTWGRNSYATSQAWRFEVPWHQVKKIQTVCGQAMLKTGYREFRSKEEMLNPNISSLHDAPDQILALN